MVPIFRTTPQVQSQWHSGTGNLGSKCPRYVSSKYPLYSAAPSEQVGGVIKVRTLLTLTSPPNQVHPTKYSSLTPPQRPRPHSPPLTQMERRRPHRLLVQRRLQCRDVGIRRLNHRHRPLVPRRPWHRGLRVFHCEYSD